MEDFEFGNDRVYSIGKIVDFVCLSFDDVDIFADKLIRQLSERMLEIGKFLGIVSD
jgi:hypothetical protein